MTTRKFSLARFAVIVPAVAFGGLLMFEPFGLTSALGPQTTIAQTSAARPPQTPQTSPRGADRKEDARQGPPQFAWWKDEAIKKYIGLPEDKAARIEEMYETRQKNLAPLIADFEAVRKERDQLIAERRVSAEELSPKVVKVEALRSKLNESRTIMLYGFSRMLTAEQYKKLMEAAEQNIHDPRPGRGGPGRSSSR